MLADTADLAEPFGLLGLQDINNLVTTILAGYQ